jgi:two-component system, cell cycle sensor histidine kinase and response regulator CckA
MPKMGGRELAEKAMPLHPEMRVLLMSGYMNDTVIAERIRASGTKFIQKPFTAAELIRKVRDALDVKGKDRNTSAQR